MLYTLQFGNYTFPNKSFAVQGFPLEKNITENNIPRRDGAVIPNPYLKPRTFKITGNIPQDSPDDGLTDLLALQAALFAGELPFYYRGDRYITARTVAITPTYPAGTDYSMIDLDIDMEAQDPYFYSAGLSIDNTFNFNGGTNSFNVDGLGNVWSEPIIYIVAGGITINDFIKLTNNTTGDYFRYRGILAPGATLELDTTQYNFTINGADGLSYFEGNFVTLVAGSNSFTYVGGTAQIIFEHKGRWFN